MDDTELNINPEDVQRMSPGEQRQLQAFVAQESQKAQLQKNIHELTEICFKKCITSSITQGKLASKEESCMANCTERFLDATSTVLKHWEHLRANQ